MGRQFQIFTTDSDNRTFLEHLQSKYQCKFFQSFAPSINELEIQNFEETYFPFSTIYIWNEEFDWRPEFDQDKTENKNFFITNKFNAPLIEFSKSRWTGNLKNGRIYWGKQNSVETYETEKFERFYLDIRDWFLKNKKETIKQSGGNIYFLEAAWNRFNDLDGA